MTDLFNIRGKVALVTGGTRGIGFMIARGFVQAGVRTYISSRKAEACAQAEAELSKFGEVFGIPSDLSDPAQVRALAETLGERENRLDILVNNAGATWGGTFDDFPESGWHKVLNLNLGAVFFLTQSLVQLLEAAGTPEDPARVINIGSVDGLAVPPFGNYPYSAAKAGLHHLTRHLAHDLASRNINLNTIAPGPFPTKMMQGMLQDHGDEIVAQIPRGRIGSEQDAAGTSIFLASRASAFITGAVIPLDGGYSTTR